MRQRDRPKPLYLVAYVRKRPRLTTQNADKIIFILFKIISQTRRTVETHHSTPFNIIWYHMEYHLVSFLRGQGTSQKQQHKRNQRGGGKPACLPCLPEVHSFFFVLSLSSPVVSVAKPGEQASRQLTYPTLQVQPFYNATQRLF